MTYEQFLESKIRTYKDLGFDAKDLNKNLFDFQKTYMIGMVRSVLKERHFYSKN